MLSQTNKVKAWRLSTDYDVVFTPALRTQHQCITRGVATGMLLTCVRDTATRCDIIQRRATAATTRALRMLTRRAHFVSAWHPAGHADRGSAVIHTMSYSIRSSMHVASRINSRYINSMRIAYATASRCSLHPHPSASVGFDFSKHVKPYHARGMPDCMMQHASDIIATSSTSQRCDVLVRFGTENTVGYMCRTAQPPPRSDGDMSATAWRR